MTSTDCHAERDVERRVEDNLGLAYAAAARFAGRGEGNDDLVQVALFGLFRAAEKYDDSRGIAFSTYATATIVGHLKHHFRDTRWGVHVPRSVQERYLRVRDEIEELSHQLGRSPTIDEIARAAGATIEEVADAIEAGRAFRIESLDTPEYAGVSPAALGEAETSAIDRTHQVDALLEGLPERERMIVRMRFLADMTQREIGERLGLSQMHVSRLLARSLEHMRRAASASN